MTADKNTNKLIEKLIKNWNLELSTNKETDDAVHKEVLTAHRETIQTQPATQPDIWRIIMKSKFTKLTAAAVVIIIVAMIGINQFGGSVDMVGVAWADVVRPLLTARTVIFNVITVEGENVPITRVMNIGTQRVRNEVLLPDGKTVQVIAIVDFDTSQMLTLNPEDKIAAFIDLKDMPEKPENVLEEMRNIITKLQEDPALLVEPLGEQELDGRIATVFRATGPDAEVTVWADPETKLPIRMEQKWRQMEFALTNFEFNVVLDESLFSMEIPEDYSALPKGELSIAGATEQDLIVTLRMWAELDGAFPKDFSTQVYMDDVPKIREKASQHSDEQNLEHGLKMARGFIFFKLLKAENDWHYVGKDVKLGDGNSPICWYKPTGSETYRVIYGDLTVKDIAPEDLPK
ncbi:MAG: hypothetical protein ACYSUX_18550 [Planctomycetota bacterium]|jgi:hypothetical protein